MRTLRGILWETADLERRMLWAGHADVALQAIVAGTCLDGAAPMPPGASVLVHTREQSSAAQALIELDGVARRLILCPPDLSQEHLPVVIRDGEVTAVVTDRPEVLPELEALPHYRIVDPRPLTGAGGAGSDAHVQTQWAMFTSGTTGPPKMVAHDLEGLTGAIKPMSVAGAPAVWATFYDIRRYGGLQILLRGLLSGGSMVVAGSEEPLVDLMRRMGRHGVTHVSGTPSHWRKALASGAADMISPAYVRLSGEIADQAILNQLRNTFPGAAIGHAYASTEAGVGFEVNDGLEGFPPSLFEPGGSAIEMKVVDGSLRIRSSRTARRYLGEAAPKLADADGFVDTGDMVEMRGERYYFAGRRGGIINVGGLKVHPEEIEAVINSFPGVRVSLAQGRRNPITGSIVIADVVLDDALKSSVSGVDEVRIRRDILKFCHDRLAAFKVPAMLRFVPALTMTEGGKLLRERTKSPDNGR